MLHYFVNNHNHLCAHTYTLIRSLRIMSHNTCVTLIRNANLANAKRTDELSTTEKENNTKQKCF